MLWISRQIFRIITKNWLSFNEVCKSILIPLGLIGEASVTDAAILKKIVGSDMTKLIILNEEKNYTMKTVKSHKESCLLKEKNKKVDFLGHLIFELILKCRSIIKINLNLMVFIQQRIYLK